MAIREGLSFDEMNKLYVDEHDGNLRSMPFRQYFGGMDLSREQKDRRIATAREMERFTRMALISMYYLHQEGIYDYSEPAAELAKSYKSMLDRMAVPFTAFFLALHIDSMVNDMVASTVDHPDDPYYFSEDRATLIAENEANSLWNDAEYQDALLTGKSYHTWHAIMDKKTRETHAEVNGMTVPIDEPFEVGDSLMMYQKDTSLGAGPEEIANCRCSVTYS